ncbi:hypothetical protein J0695_41255, partial [Streptomyces beijiangensis]|nr:hypothetical protein [Streptomyces beijiangensis]
GDTTPYLAAYLVPVPGPLGHDGGLGDVRMGRQGGFHLAGFDAVAADLDLGVDASQVLQLAVAGEAGEVAGAVPAR